MARKTLGTTDERRARLTPEEARMLAEIRELLGLQSLNLGLRWAIRYAHQHATVTDDHSTHPACSGTSTCANATRGLTAPAGRQRTAGGGDLFTHSATVETLDDHACP